MGLIGSNKRFLNLTTSTPGTRLLRHSSEQSASVVICQCFRFVGEGSVSKVAPSTKEVNLGDVTSRSFQESSF